MIQIKNRTMVIPKMDRYIGTTQDNHAESRIFQIERYTSSTADISNLTFKLATKDEKGNANLIYLEKAVEEDRVILTWTISENDVGTSGTMLAQIKAFDEMGTLRWNSFIGVFYVEKNLNMPDVSQEQLSDYEVMLQKVTKALEELDGAMIASVDMEDGNLIITFADETTESFYVKGEQGPGGTVTLGDVTYTESTEYPKISQRGTPENRIFDFELPLTGPQGEQGEAATIQIGQVTTGEPGTQAAVTNSGTQSAAVLDFSIPRGEPGEQGEAATIQIGQVTTGEPGTQAAVTNSGTQNAAVLDFTIPKGADGEAGEASMETVLTYDTPDSYTAPKTGDKMNTWLGKVTKGLADFFTSLDAKVNKSSVLEDYGSIMSNQTEGFWADALAIKAGFNAKANASHSHTKAQITDFSHTHDDRYYTESEINNKINALNASITAVQTTANAAMPKTGGTFSGSVTVGGGIEIRDTSPHIDFHFNKSSADYTSRIIEDISGTLDFYGSNNGGSIRQASSRGVRGFVVSCESFPITLVWTGSTLDAYVQNNYVGHVQLTP